MSLFSRISNIIVPSKEQNKAPIIPQQLSRIRQDATSRKNAIEEAERAYFPYRVKLQQMYLNTRENGHIKSCIERRKDMTLLRKWVFKNVNGEIDKTTTDIFCYSINGQKQIKTWFSNYLNYCLDAIYYGYSVISLGDIIDDNLNNLSIVKRWNCSPDRRCISSFPYMPNGASWDGEQYRDWYIYINTPNDIGTSVCGYGLYYELSMYEIFMRNLLGFNGDFVELFSQPLRVIKTMKTDETERSELFNAGLAMGTSGLIMMDPQDEIELVASQLGGTGFQGYADFEKRLEAKCSQLILGHENAMIAKPSALGGGEESPEHQAMEDKQTKDATFILPLVNNELFSRMRNLGFNIPDGVVACMTNDNEEVENADNIAELAVKMKQGGLQLDSKYFSDKTGIPTTEILTPQPKGIGEKAMNQIKNIYGS